MNISPSWGPCQCGRTKLASRTGAQVLPRITPLRPEQLTPAQAELYQHITTGPRAQGPQHFALTDQHGALRGPFNALLLSPALGTALQQLGAAVRYSTALSARVREIAILLVAAHWQSAFEQEAHESIGASVGLSAEQLTQLRAGELAALDDPIERLCGRITKALVVGDLDESLWTEAHESLSPAIVFELTTLVGYYSTLALQLRVFRVQ